MLLARLACSGEQARLASRWLVQDGVILVEQVRDSVVLIRPGARVALELKSLLAQHMLLIVNARRPANEPSVRLLAADERFLSILRHQALIAIRILRRVASSV